MKNLLVYTNAAKDFSEENKILVKIHIDNSLELGWSRDDILLYTNFPYEYNGVKATVVDDKLDLEWDRQSNKIFVINDLLKKNLLKKDLYWYHDFDAYQNNVITEEEIEMGDCDLAITGYGYKPQANGGSFFFTEKSGDLFEYWCKKTVEIVRTRADEKSLTDMTRDGKLKRYKWLNITYNFGMRHTKYNWDRADKPLKVLHFHPHYNDWALPYPTKDCFMYGKNPMGHPLMTERLIKLFNKHGIS